MLVPYELLKPETLRAVIEDFITREGTDYGAREYTLEEKTKQVMHQLERGDAAIVFDEKTESCSIISTRN